MKRQPRILAGTAMGLLMASAPLGAFPLQSGNFTRSAQNTINAPLYLAQAKCAEDETAEECAARQAEPKEAEPQQAEPEQAAPEPEAAPAEQPAPAAEEPAPAVEEAAPAQEAAPPAEAAPAPAEQPAPATEEAPATQQAEPEAPAVESEQKPRKKKEKKAKESVEQTPVDEAAPAPEQPPAQTEAPAEEPATQAEPAPQDSEQAPINEKPVNEAPAQETTQQPPAEAEQPAPEQQPAAEQPADSGQAAPAEAEQPVEGEAAAPQNPEAAPILDSQKDAKRNRKRKGKNGEAAAEENQAASPEQAPAEQAPPPVDDKAAQQAITPEAIVPVTEEQGKRRQSAPDVQSRERPNGADVLKEIGGRVIIQFNNQTLVESSDRDRMTRGAKNVYYEDLPRGRTRETIERKNGSQIVTIRNRNGDIIRRSRITPDGREFVLNYVDESHYDDLRDWRDPGDDLPPMRLRIPRNQYILDSRSVEGPDAYYDFLEQPPVERVQRLYSVSEVKRSARVRDIARRIDLDTLNFEFGSASISDEDVQKLEAVASAMEKLLEKNPAETFLIEGHTDAVGTEAANLALSDQRAEAVAQALTNAFGIPPENLSTQGYGEEYLKVDTTKPERENRRVAIRRITSLVAPVASAN